MRVKATVKNTRLPEEVRGMIREKLKEFEGRNISIEIKLTNDKTLAQYGYLYSAIYPVIKKALKELTGEDYDIQDIDFIMKRKFWYKESLNFETGEVERIPNIKRNMNKYELSEYIDSVMKWCEDFLNVKVPNPDEWHKEPFKIEVL